MSDFYVKKGNLVPVVAATLLKSDGTPFDLTGCAVAFNAQGPAGFTGLAVIVTPAAGTVTYTFSAGQTDVPGDYRAEWLVTLPDLSVRRFPETGYLTFTVLEALPVVAPPNTTLLSSAYEDVQAILGDFDAEFRAYEDAAIAKVLRMVIRCGQLEGYSLTADLRGVTPAITVPRVWARWVFNAAKRLLGPNVASFSFRTRPLSQAMGNQREFFRDIENTLYDLENDGVFVTWTSYYSWVNSITGMNVWQNLSQMHVVAPVAEVTVGRDGVKVTSS